VNVRIIGTHDKTIGFLRVEVKNARFAMIDPDDAMMMFGHCCLVLF
jgi:hypothetical protein